MTLQRLSSVTLDFLFTLAPKYSLSFHNPVVPSIISIFDRVQNTRIEVGFRNLWLTTY